MYNIDKNRLEILKATVVSLEESKDKVKEIKRSNQIISLEEMTLLHKIQNLSTEIYNLTRDKMIYM